MTRTFAHRVARLARVPALAAACALLLAACGGRDAPAVAGAAPTPEQIARGRYL
ncbi:cytochrome c, partial [Burkholderia stagnalis]